MATQDVSHPPGIHSFPPRPPHPPPAHPPPGTPAPPTHATPIDTSKLHGTGVALGVGSGSRLHVAGYSVTTSGSAPPHTEVATTAAEALARAQQYLAEHEKAVHSGPPTPPMPATVTISAMHGKGEAY